MVHVPIISGETQHQDVHRGIVSIILDAHSRSGDRFTNIVKSIQTRLCTLKSILVLSRE